MWRKSCSWFDLVLNLVVVPLWSCLPDADEDDEDDSVCCDVLLLLMPALTLLTTMPEQRSHHVSVVFVMKLLSLLVCCFYSVSVAFLRNVLITCPIQEHVVDPSIYPACVCIYPSDADKLLLTHNILY